MTRPQCWGVYVTHRGVSPGAQTGYRCCLTAAGAPALTDWTHVDSVLVFNLCCAPGLRYTTS
ncbi:unnamed protein product [Ixodes persulcatus]